MTTWAAPAVANFCRKAGWRTTGLADAIAVALAASGGADHYSYNPGHLAATERKGLFAMLDSEHDLGPDADLFSPGVAALAAFQRWRAAGQQWSWHLAWASGAAAKQRDYVVASLRQGAQHDVPPAPGTFADHLQRAMFLTAQIKEAGARVRRPHD